MIVLFFMTVMFGGNHLTSIYIILNIYVYLNCKVINVTFFV